MNELASHVIEKVNTFDIIAALQEIDQSLGVDLESAGQDGLAFALKRIPTGQAAEELAARLVTLCPDLY